MILSCQNINKSFGTNVIVSQVSFHLEEKEKAALVGANGTGKSTLLKIIAGTMPADSGEVVLAKNKFLGYLAQHQDMETNRTVFEELLEVKRPIIELEEKIRQTEQLMKLSAGAELEQLLASYTHLTEQFDQQNGYAYKSEVTGILKGLGFDQQDFDKPVWTLSGGQKTRVALGRLLLLKPDILLLDEPTNHLDMDSIAWLETFLRNYDGAIIIVSHDRYFLDRVVTRVLELDQTVLQIYNGNYSVYAGKREMIREAKLKAYLNQQRELKHQQEVITRLRSFNREKSIKRAESREKLVDKMALLDKPTTANTSMRIILEPCINSGNDVLHAEALSKSYDGITLFSGIGFDIRRGERVAVIGQNGTGKTTLLKILNGLIAADDGTFTLGSNVHVGYYDQEHQILHMDKTIFEELSDAYPNLTNTQIRNVLAAFLFTGDDVFAPVKTLSGGERGRVSLAKLMLSEANFLILDEPTNHLDIISKEILESALNHYTGTVLYVSHDRYFINRTATRILDLTNQTLVNYIGSYDYYLEKKEMLTPIYAPGSEQLANNEQLPHSKQNWQQQKEAQAKERKRQHDLEKVEQTIETLEQRDREIDELLLREEICRDAAKCIELSAEKTMLSDQLQELLEQWELLLS